MPGESGYGRAPWVVGRSQSSLVLSQRDTWVCSCLGNCQVVGKREKERGWKKEKCWRSARGRLSSHLQPNRRRDLNTVPHATGHTGQPGSTGQGTRRRMPGAGGGLGASQHLRGRPPVQTVDGEEGRAQGERIKALRCAFVKVTESCPTFCDPKDYIVQGILQARIPEWVAFPFSRGIVCGRLQRRRSHLSHKWILGSSKNKDMESRFWPNYKPLIHSSLAMPKAVPWP